jgi:hypothetical protein
MHFGQIKHWEVPRADGRSRVEKPRAACMFSITRRHKATRLKKLAFAAFGYSAFGHVGFFGGILRAHDFAMASVTP